MKRKIKEGGHTTLLMSTCAVLCSCLELMGWINGAGAEIKEDLRRVEWLVKKC